MHRNAALMIRASGSLALVAAIATVSSISLAQPKPVHPSVVTRSVSECQGSQQACIDAIFRFVAALGEKCAYTASNALCVPVVTPPPVPKDEMRLNLQRDDLRRGFQQLFQYRPDLFPNK